jgi:uncharacterized membrane protein YkgB
MERVHSTFDLSKTRTSTWGRFKPREAWLGRAGLALSRYGLVLILLYLGAFKFTEAEAHGIEPLVTNSPLFHAAHQWLGAQGLSNAIGVSEIGTALLIAARPFSARACAWGSLAAVATFLVTLTFLFSTPGIWISMPSFPLPVANELGWFLLKDVFLLGAALHSAAEAVSVLGAESAAS